MTNPRLIGTIEQREGAFGIATGCSFYPLEGNSGIAHDWCEQFNEAGTHDIGKRVFNDRGSIVMENAEQRDRRIFNEGSI